MARLEQNVLRLDIPVHDPKPVRVAQGISDLACDPQGVVEVELFLTGQTLAQGFALDVGHHVVQQSSSLTGVDQHQNVGMSEPGGDLDLAEKALRAKCGGELRFQDLDGDPATVFAIFGQINGRHPPVA